MTSALVPAGLAPAVLALVLAGSAVHAETPARPGDIVVTADGGLSPDKARRIDAAVVSTLKAENAPSASVAIVRDGVVVYAKAFGYADLAARRPSTPLTRYEIASVSKEFTAAAILLLQEDGKLSLDDKVARWLPDLTDADKVSVRQLLSHTSGYSDYWPQDYIMKPMMSDTTPRAILDGWAKRPLDYKPGDKWQYSNTGYVIAGQIIEKVTGEPLFVFLKRRIFDPLGMTGVRDADTIRRAGGADSQGYQRYALGPQRPVDREGRGWLYAMGEMNATASDVAKWDAALMAGKLLKPESLKAMTTEVKLNDGRGSGYGLGLFVGKSDDRLQWEHTGEGTGFLSENRMWPERKTAVVVLTNTFSSSAYVTVADKVEAILFPAQGVQTQVERLFAGLQAGKPDRAAFTDNFNGYLTAQAVADYHATLGPLGPPTTFKLQREQLRGGMTHRTYRITAGGKTLTLNSYQEPSGKFEQFLIDEAH
jgi:CubicO group peptidase (beta-lactamase class C family)